MRTRLIAWCFALPLAGCTTLAASRISGPLFSESSGGERLDFENQPLGRAPSGFVSGPTNWSVADSPTAASGEQVLVHTGEEASAIQVEGGRGAKELRAEAAVRVFVGKAGAGVACAAEDESGYLVRFEPEAKRVALYDRSGEDFALVGERALDASKGKWVRLGIRCGRGQVVGYLDGEVMASRRTEEAPSAIELHADAAVTAQFDDLRYIARD